MNRKKAYTLALFLLILITSPVICVIYLIRVVENAMKKHPDEHYMMQSQKSVQELANQIRRIAGELSAGIGRIEDDPMGRYGTTYELAVVLSGKNRDFMRSIWAVQIYIEDQGDKRCIELVALSESARLNYGGIDLSESKKKCEVITGRLK